LKKLICAAACFVAAAALAPAGASALPGAEQSRLVAVGTDGRTLTCATALHNHRYTGSTYYKISGSTTCGGAIQQSCALTLPNDYAPYTVSLSDSVFDSTCSLSSGAEGENWGSLIYRTVVHAPTGMKWIGVPTQCSGVGTDTLDCTFTTGESPL
jgi:hypothetical protein